MWRGKGGLDGGGGVWTVHARKFWCIGARARCRKNGLCTAWARLEVGRYGLKPSISVAIECVHARRRLPSPASCLMLQDWRLQNEMLLRWLLMRWYDGCFLMVLSGEEVPCLGKWILPRSCSHWSHFLLVDFMALIPPSCECATNWAGVEMLSWANHEFENSLTKNVSRPASLSGRHWLQANSSSSLQSSLLFFFSNFFWHFFLEVGLVHFFLCRCSEAGRFWFWGGLPDRVGVWRVVWVFAPEKLQTLWSSVSESL